MISSKLIEFIDTLNNKGLEIKLKNRVSSFSWNYDGKTIALLYEPLNVISKIKYLVKDEEINLFEENIYNLKWYTDHDILHEIGHWLAAKQHNENQLLYPEYGLNPCIIDPKASGSLKDKYDAFDMDLKGYVNENEQIIQEIIANQISLYLIEKLNLSAELHNLKISNTKYKTFVKKQIKNFWNKKEISERYQEIINWI